MLFPNHSGLSVRYAPKLRLGILQLVPHEIDAGQIEARSECVRVLWSKPTCPRLNQLAIERFSLRETARVEVLVGQRARCGERLGRIGPRDMEIRINRAVQQWLC
jgi:hypothetical protein